MLMEALRDARAYEAEQAAKVKALREAFESTIAEDVAALQDAKARTELAERNVKESALASYRETGDKKPLVGAEVKVFTKLEYAEPDALAWAQNTGLCLTLDKKAFEKVAKASQLPFVREVEEPRVTIATDLAKALA